MGQPADGIVRICPRAVGGRLRDTVAGLVISVIKLGIDGLVRRVVDDMEQFAGAVVLIGRKGAVAHVGLEQPARRIVGVLHDAGLVAVRQFGQLAEVIVGVIDGEAVLIDHLDAPPGVVVGVLQGLAVRIGDLAQLVLGGVILQLGRAGRVGGRSEVAVRIVNVGLLGPVGQRLRDDAPGAVVLHLDGLAAAIGQSLGISHRVVNDLLRAVVGIGGQDEIGL